MINHRCNIILLMLLDPSFGRLRSQARGEGPLVPRAVGPAQDAVAVALVSLSARMR